MTANLPAGRRPRTAATDREAGNLTLAVVFTVLVTLFAFLLVATVTAGQTKTRHARDWAKAQQAADQAVNDALMRANLQTLTEPGDPSILRAPYACTPPGGGQPVAVTGFTVTWCATATTGTATGDSWDLTVTVTSPTLTRRYTVTLAAVRVSAGGTPADGSDGHVRYRITPEAALARGFFADQDITLRGSARVTSYNSTTGAQDTGHGTIGSNNLINLGSTAAKPADQIVLWDYAAAPYSDRCVAAASGGALATSPCDTTPTTRYPIRLDVSDPDPAAPSLDSPNRFITDRCAPFTPQPWVASRDSHTLTAGTCYASLTFDTPQTPVVVVGAGPVYVLGDIAVQAGATINANPSDQDPDARQLAIYSRGERVTIDGADWGPHTRVGWTLWAPNATCAGATGRVEVFGAMTCSRLSVQGGWTLAYDDQITGLANPADTYIWSVTRYQER